MACLQSGKGDAGMVNGIQGSAPGNSKIVDSTLDEPARWPTLVYKYSLFWRKGQANCASNAKCFHPLPKPRTEQVSTVSGARLPAKPSLPGRQAGPKDGRTERTDSLTPPQVGGGS